MSILLLEELTFPSSLSRGYAKSDRHGTGKEQDIDTLLAPSLSSKDKFRTMFETIIFSPGAGGEMIRKQQWRKGFGGLMDWHSAALEVADLVIHGL